jgi:hypothetical protein
MTKGAIAALVVGIVAIGAAAAAYAAPSEDQTTQTPKGWSYDLKGGQRVPKGNRVTNADGSWREEISQGNCSTVKERSAAGDYKESRQCSQK